LSRAHGRCAARDGCTRELRERRYVARVRYSRQGRQRQRRGAQIQTQHADCAPSARAGRTAAANCNSESETEAVVPSALPKKATTFSGSCFPLFFPLPSVLPVVET